MNATCDEKAIFLDALDCVCGQERDHFVEQACRGNAPLRSRVEQLLRAHEHAKAFLGGGAAAAETWDGGGDTPPGTKIGPYKLLQQIGAGGMGVVYRAEQVEPVERRVAVKVIRPGFDTAQVISRFAAERQALALMDHPNIARVLDAGTVGQTASDRGWRFDEERPDAMPQPLEAATSTGHSVGQPYFVMELVDGVSITAFCDQRRQTIAERLKLFITVCQAVQHAHQKGVIHRDLKPSNILVTEIDGEPIPKIIDFGIAKAIGQAGLDGAGFTLTGQIVGTPEYMSPEQAGQEKCDVDTRSDIYSLGVLLYELLTGTTPFRRERTAANNLSELLRAIRDVDPKPPSERIASSVSSAAAVEPSGTDPTRRKRAVRGDLDWIVLKCLEKSPERRYQSAGSLADDIRRHLAGLPVEAHRPSRWYQARKFVARNRWPVVSAISALVLLVGGLVGTGFGLRRATLAYEHQRRLLYCADMNLAMEAWRANDQPRAIALLRRHVPLAHEVDLRGFEWYHLWERLHRYKLPTIELPHKPSSVVFAPDGAQFAVGLMNGVVLVYDAKNLQQVDRFGKELPTYNNWIRVRYSSDGSRLAFQNQREVTVVELPSRQIDRLHAPSEVRTLSISGDSQRLAAGMIGGKIMLWDLLTAKPAVELDAAPLTNVQSLVFSHSGQKLVAGGQGKAVKIWDDLTKSTRPRELSAVRVWGTSIRFSPDDKVLASSLTKDVTLWRLPSGAKLHELPHDERVHIYDFSPDGLNLASGTRDGKIHIWNAQKEVLLAEWPAHTGAVQALTFSPDSQTLITAGSDRRLRVGSAQFRPQRDFVLISNSVQFAQVTSDGQNLITVMGQAGRMRRHLQTRKLSTRETLPLDFPGWDNIECAAVSRRDQIAVAVRDAEVLLLEQLGKRWQALPISSSQPAVITSLAFSPDEKLFAVGRENGAVGLWDVAGRREVAVLPSEPGAVRSLRFTRDSRVLATARARTVILWQRPGSAPGGTWTETKRLPNQPAEVLTIEFDPRDDGTLAAGTNGNAVLLWRWRTDQPPRTFTGHSEGVYDVTFSPDGMSLVSGGADQNVVFWDLATEQQRARMALVSPIEGEALAFSPDGQTLVCGDFGWRLYFWLSATKAQVREAGW